MGNHLNNYTLILMITSFLLVKCTPKETKKEINYELDSIWEKDSATGDLTYFPFERQFEEIVENHLEKVDKLGETKFLYNTQLDTLYRWYNSAYRPTKSVRAAIISKINNVDYLKDLLHDDDFIRVWEKAKQDSANLKTNVEMITARLNKLESEL